MIDPLIVASGISALSSLLGGGSSSVSKNKNRDVINANFTGAAGSTGDATDALTALLGLGGSTAATDAGWNKFRDSTGYKFGLDQGLQALMGNRAAGGLLNSGSTLKAATQFGTDYANTKYEDYLNNIMNLGQLGLGAGGLITQAGQYSKSKSGKK